MLFTCYFLDGEQLLYDVNAHGENPLNVLYYNDVQCPDNATSLDDCTSEGPVDDESCYSTAYVLRCFNMTQGS